ncbi:MAG: hypothetical protein MI923_13630, partial [Phycisphaerales bacterium]|nr:hypothetical protein [Phycisphaerales bacterium]
MSIGKELPVRAFEYTLEFQLRAPAAVVWDAMTVKTNDWWLPDFHVAASNSIVSLDTRLGGHLIERTEEGGGIIWFTVHACTPGRSLTLIGPLCLDCGPATTMLTLSLQDNEEGC